MNINDYLSAMPPNERASKIKPFMEQIKILKSQGYNNEQVCDWLKTNGVVVSREAVRKFIKRYLSTDRPVKGHYSSTREDQQRVPSGLPDAHSNALMGETRADMLKRQFEMQKREYEDKLFKHNKTGKS